MTTELMDTHAGDVASSNKRRRTEEPGLQPQPQPQPLSDPANYPRKRVSVACELCRMRKTRCDAARPSCSFCVSVGVVCNYRKPSGVIANLMTRAKQGEKFQNLQSRVDHLEHALQTANSKILPSPPLDVAPASATSSTPVSTQGFSPPVAVSIETPRRTSSTAAAPIADVRTASFTLPTIGLSRTVANLGRLANQPCPEVFQPLEYDDSEEYIESELHKEELISSCGDPTQIDVSARACWQHQQVFVKNILPWYPLISQDTCVYHMSRAQEAQFSTTCPSTPLALYILALGAFSRADQLRGDDPREFPGLDYFNAAREIPERSGIRYAIEVIQSQILRTLFFILCMRPAAAVASIQPACRSMVSLLHLKRHLHNEPYFRTSCHRAYWACFIIEKELLPYSGFCTPGFVELHEIVPLPLSAHDEPGMLWLLSEIALRRIFINVSGSETDTEYQPLVMHELNTQLAKWYEALPLAIKFAPGSSPILDPQKAFLRAQYYSACFVSYWAAVVRLYTAPPEGEEQHKELLAHSAKALEVGVMYIDAMESSIFDRHVMLYANLLGTYCVTMLLLCIYGTHQVAQMGVDIERTIRKGHEFISSWQANPNVFAKLNRMQLLMRDRSFPL